MRERTVRVCNKCINTAQDLVAFVKHKIEDRGDDVVLKDRGQDVTLSAAFREIRHVPR